MDILRFLTAGSVDDGKSTLIGRLLYDSKNILVDQLAAIERSTKNKTNGAIDLALLTDGLRAEREQGITIDVAYKYFSTPKRKFIIADAPGHVQYTRNMITGASNVDLIIILIDARHGVVEQTRRHSLIASLLNIPQVVVAINKMDLVDFEEERYNQIKADYDVLADKLGIKNQVYIPISALNGDNIVESSENTPWYHEQPLLSYLENVTVSDALDYQHGRFAVQYVIRPQTEDLHDYRGYAGKVNAGVFKKGDTIKVYPSDIEGSIKSIEINGKEVEQAFAGQSVVLQLNEDIDVSRGMYITKQDEQLKIEKEIDASICWMDENKPLKVGNKYLLQHRTNRVLAIVKNIDYKLDVNTLEKEENISQAVLNEVVGVKLKLATPIAYDSYQELRENGGAILIDQSSYGTVGAVLLQ